MKKILFTFFCLCIWHCTSFCQVKTNIWELGYNPGGGCFYFNFDSVPLHIGSLSRTMNFLEANSSICNSAGEINFYTNGIYVANRNNDTMLNGNDLNPSTYTSTYASDGLHFSQANIIIPFPNDTSKFYLFHETVYWVGNSYQPLELYESIIDMTLDGGLGEITVKNNAIFQDTLMPGELTACKHANGRDWWLICHHYQSDLFYKFLITPYGIQNPLTQNIGSHMQFGSGGQACFSPNGKWYARYNPYDTDLDIMEFDRCSGDFSNQIHVDFNDSAGAGGAAFSSNSNVLYVTSSKYIYQFDLTAANIPSSQKTVATWDGYYSPQPPFASTFYLAQLAPDNKIYISCGNGTVDMHVINFPDSLDTLCSVCQHCIHLPSYNAFTIPNHPNYNLGADTASILCDSLSIGITESEIKKDILVFPNPFINKLTINFADNKNEGAALKILDTLGNLILTKNNFHSNQQLDCSFLNSGIYFLSIQTNENNTLMKIIKM